MADGSTIEWLSLPGYGSATWNPTRGCSRQGDGCANCWAIGQARRQDVPGGAYEGLTTIRRWRVDWTGVSRPVPEMLDRPLRWRKPRCIFVESMGDLWHPGIPFEYAAAVLGVCAVTSQHRHIILTKQARRMRECFAWIDDQAARCGTSRCMVMQQAARNVLGDRFPLHKIKGTFKEFPWPLPNVALLVSAWDQESAARYVPDLLATPAAVRGVSAEPLLGAMNLRRGFRATPTRISSSQEFMERAGIDWVIAGGESGPKARPMHPDWVRSLRDQCQDVGVPFFFKQWGGKNKKQAGRELDGRTWYEFPRAWT